MSMWSSFFERSSGGNSNEQRPEDFKAPQLHDEEPLQSPESSVEIYPDDEIITNGTLHMYNHPNSGESYLAVDGHNDLQVAVVKAHVNNRWIKIYPTAEEPAHDIYNYLDDDGYGPTFNGRLQYFGNPGSRVGCVLIENIVPLQQTNTHEMSN